MKATIILTIFNLIVSGYAMASEEKIIYGYVEKAVLVDKQFTLSAKLDTGAKSASLSAVNIQEIEQNGQLYLKFTVPTRDGDAEFTAPYLGKVKIKTRTEELHHAMKRPVVLMKVQLGDKIQEIPLNLTNRKRFIYPLLLGRKAIMAFSGLVDPSLAFSVKLPSVKKDAVK